MYFKSNSILNKYNNKITKIDYVNYNLNKYVYSFRKYCNKCDYNYVDALIYLHKLKSKDLENLIKKYNAFYKFKKCDCNK